MLVEASTLTAVQFCQKEMPDEASDEALQSALQEVGFPAEMQLKSVSELSGGWRMKLLAGLSDDARVRYYAARRANDPLGQDVRGVAF